MIRLLRGIPWSKVLLIGGLASLACLVAVLYGHLSQRAMAQEDVEAQSLTKISLTAEDQERSLRQAAQAVFAEQAPGQAFEVGLTRIVGDWALVNFRVDSLEKYPENSGGEVYLGLGQWDGQRWSIAVEGSDQFLTWLDEVPTKLISTEARRYLNPTVSTAANAPGLWLPFPVGQTWKFLAGPNGSHRREAVDFGPFRVSEKVEPNPLPTAPLTGRERDVTAAATGVVVDRDDNLLIIRHAGNPPWETAYFSLAAASNLGRLGQVVYQGERIGAASAEGDWDKGVHVRFWVRRHDADQIIAGQVLSEWKIFQDNGYAVGQETGRIVYRDGTERIDCQTVERLRLADDLCHVHHFSVTPDPLSTAFVSLDPITLTVPLSSTGVSEVLIDQATNVSGVQLSLSYSSPVSITVVDAFPGTLGIQVGPGSIFEDVPTRIIQNEVDPLKGVIDFWAELQVPTPAFKGSGSLLEITWLRQEMGPVEVKLDRIHLTDPNERIIPTVITPTGLVNIQSGSVLQGQVALQGREDRSGVTLVADDRQLHPNADGRFKFGIAENYQFTLTAPGYLSAQVAGDLIKSGQTIELGRIELLGGDVTGDGQINIFDLALIAGHYGTPETAADLNGDGNVNIFDLTITASNYRRRGPVMIP